MARLKQQSKVVDSVPKSLQPLLTFPLNDEINNDKFAVQNNDGITNQEGKCAIWIADFEGNFRYVSETSPLSLLYECRNIFRQNFGSSPFTGDLKACPIIDRPLAFDFHKAVPLPTIKEYEEFMTIFFEQINDTYFIFDEVFFNDLVKEVYANPEKLSYKKVVVYLVAAISSLYQDFSEGHRESERTAQYFRYSQLLNSQIVDFDDFWLVLIFYATHFYYLGVCKKSTSWIYLNMAIKHAQALGLHRHFIVEQVPDQVNFRKQIFRSLYISDRVFASINGRPLAIHDYDWDELHQIQKSSFSEDFTRSEQCQLELAKICAIISKIIDNFYRDRVINAERTKKLAVELKLWSYNLDHNLNIESLLNSKELPPNNRCLLVMHLLNLYGIMLLSRPYYMYVAISKFKQEKKLDLLTIEFHQAAIKASFLCINLVNYYVNTTATRFFETALVSNCCCFAALILGTEILSTSNDDVKECMEVLDTAKCLLRNFGVQFETADRYGEIIEAMIASIKATKAPAKKETTTSFNWDMADIKFIGELNGNLLSLLEFQQDFVPKEIASIGDFISSDSSSLGTIKTDLPHNYVNYELFFGDKY